MSTGFRRAAHLAAAALSVMLTAGCLVSPAADPGPEAVQVSVRASAYDPMGSEYAQRITITVSTIGIDGKEGRWRDGNGVEHPGPQVLPDRSTPYLHNATVRRDIISFSITFAALIPRGGRLECWVIVDGRQQGARQGQTVPLDAPTPAVPITVTCLYP